MINYDSLFDECYNYIKNFKDADEDSKSDLYDLGYDLSLIWGMTFYESFKEVVLSVKRPKRFVVFGSSIGYQCFFWNKIFPDIPCIGIDIMSFRVNFGNSMIEKYNITNVELLKGDIVNFEIKNGDLIWQNNLMFNEEFIENFSFDLLFKFDVEIISYKKLLHKKGLLDKSKHFEFLEKHGSLKIIKEKNFKINTTWGNDQSIVYYYRYQTNNFYDVNFIKSEYIIPEKYLKDYDSLNYSKRFVKSDEIRMLYNKYYNKMKFIEMGFDVPNLIFYSNKKTDISPILIENDKWVAKPAHFSESVDVYVNSGQNNIDIQEVNNRLNDRIDISDRGNWRRQSIGMDIHWKDTERGIIIEEYINVIYELKVFVVFGEPLIADLRDGFSELYTIDFIGKENKYFNWDKEYELIKEFAKSLKIDFFRIDFLYDGSKVYASELTFMPATFLPNNIQEIIANKLRMPYLKYYYPQFC